MKSVLCIIFLVYSFNLCINSGYALRCFSCSAHTGHKNACEVSVNNRTVATAFCSYGYTTCMTLVVSNTVTRACALNNACSTYYNSPGYISCSTCVHDLCNHIATTSGIISTYVTSLGALDFVYVIVKCLQ